jgi:hypothetical protein
MKKKYYWWAAYAVAGYYAYQYLKSRTQTPVAPSVSGLSYYP